MLKHPNFNWKGIGDILAPVEAKYLQGFETKKKCALIWLQN